MPRTLPPIHMTDPQDAELDAYRPLAEQAVIGLILGLLSPVAIWSLWFLEVPLLGVFFSVWALRRIKKTAPALRGCKTATAGLMISLLCVAAAPANFLVYRHMVYRETQQVVDRWFRYLLENQPHKSFEWMLAPESRKPANVPWCVAYHRDSGKRKELEYYALASPMRMLLALGPRAQARFYQNVSQWYDTLTKSDMAELLYAVTYDDAGERKSFFVKFLLQRLVPEPGQVSWQVWAAQAVPSESEMRTSVQ